MKTPHSFEELYRQIETRKTAFFIAFFIIVSISYAVLYAIDFIPEPVSETTSMVETRNVVGETPSFPYQDSESESYTQSEVQIDTTSAVSDASEIVPLSDISEQYVDGTQTTNEQIQDREYSAGRAELPRTLIFDSLGGKQVTVLNPTSRAIEDLDQALLGGVVRHPDSADHNNIGNILILGHSSYLPNVLNRNFQAFNGIQNMKWGDRIRVVSDTTEYHYRVEKVYEALASDLFVSFTPGEARLTLATCDSFGTKDDRFIVEATLVGERPL